ncbi:hypothetical protein [Pseudobutyrivibrio ruminis]|uniref:Uncharacterized protein n=1 Tax=Pseudobutyrivibrio ruminis TaxID=46206 RepID=A0A2G3DU80_9FIRM|nr:hypothetical protein [Pseudobutyrivibrio ruminis]PHU34450.1 hypothetical protein CSX01_10065 [Pseudobutyrivibrio ruminis]
MVAERSFVGNVLITTDNNVNTSRRVPNEVLGVNSIGCNSVGVQLVSKPKLIKSLVAHPINVVSGNKTDYKAFILTNDCIYNLKKLSDISRLETNWNGNGARKISKKLINEVQIIIEKIVKQPEIFPLPDGRIQFEYESNEGYMEINIGSKNKVEVSILKNKKEKTFLVQKSFGDIDKVVEEFYG